MIPSECGFDPMGEFGQPIGMFHCPECGEMVVAGLPHPGELEDSGWEEVSDGMVDK
jgi:hypothetical protein